MPSSRPVLVLCRLKPSTIADLAARFRLLDLHASPFSLDAFLVAAAADDDPPRAAVVPGSGVVRVNAAFLDAVPSLRCVVSVSAGLNHFDLPECARRGVAVANAAGIYSADVADYAVGLLIDVLRGVSAGDRSLRRHRGGEFVLPPLGTRLGGKRVGILGLGSIGSAVARRLEPFGCVVSYHSRRQKRGVSYRYHPTARDLAASSDVLVVACALTAETRHVVDRPVLDALGSGGVLVNVARGANVDEAELVSALAEGRIAGAGLEVFEDEPHVPAELLGMDNVVLTHHQAVYTPESMADLDRLVAGNLEAFFASAPLLTPVLVSDRPNKQLAGLLALELVAAVSVTNAGGIAAIPIHGDHAAVARRREPAGAPGAAALPGVRRGARQPLPVRARRGRRRGDRGRSEGAAGAGPDAGHGRAPGQAPCAGARAGHLRGRRPRGPRRVSAPRDRRHQRRPRVRGRLGRLRRRARRHGAPQTGRRRRVRPAWQVGCRRRLPAHHKGEREACGDRGAGQHRLRRRAAPRRLRLRGLLPLEVPEAIVAVHVRARAARPRRRQRRAGALLRADGGDKAHGEPGGDGGAGEGRRAGQRRPRRPGGRAGAGAVPAGGRPRRRRAGRVRERAGRAAGAVRHGQRGAVGPQGGDHAGVHARRARGHRRQPRRLLLREAAGQPRAALRREQRHRFGEDDLQLSLVMI